MTGNKHLTKKEEEDRVAEEENRAEISLDHNYQNRQKENQHLCIQKNVQDLPRIIQEQLRSRLYQNIFPSFLESAYILTTNNFFNNIILGLIHGDFAKKFIPFLM